MVDWWNGGMVEPKYPQDHAGTLKEAPSPYRASINVCLRIALPSAVLIYTTGADSPPLTARGSDDAIDAFKYAAFPINDR